MKIKTSLFKIEIEILVITLIFISIFSLKVRQYLEMYYICYLFILFHELSHMCVGAILGEKIELLKITLSGVNVSFSKDILTSNISLIKKMLIYLAGPISNMILAMMFRDIKLVYEINIFLAILNLIPIFPLDGYNILYILTKYVKKENKNIMNNLSIIIIIMFFVISIIQVMLYKTFSFALFSIYLYLLRKNMNKSNIRY